MTFTFVPVERTVTYSQIGLRLVDELTGGPALQRVDARLRYQTGGGNWQLHAAPPVLSPSGNLLFPGLGRSASVAVAPILHYRVELTSPCYRPAYLRTVDALAFDVHPYDDDHPPAVLPTLPQTVLLLPSVNYPHASFVRTLRGTTVDTNGAPLANVEVTLGAAERVLSDERGVFALPLRWAAFSGNIVIDAIDHRTGRTDQRELTLPHALQQGQTFTLS